MTWREYTNNAYCDPIEVPAAVRSEWKLKDGARWTHPGGLRDGAIDDSKDVGIEVLGRELSHQSTRGRRLFRGFEKHTVSGGDSSSLVASDKRISMVRCM
jgi:hypothetical protein